MRKVLAGAVGVLALSLGAASVASAGQFAVAAHAGYQLSPRANWATTPASSPEIDPAGAFSGLTLLLGGLAIVRGRRIKK